jgi:predicted nucleic acid-binding Zn ribbon protein
LSDELRLHCPDCGKNIPMPPHACPECGQIMNIRGKMKRSTSPVVVVLLLFLLLGPFGLGMLWRNDRFELPWKIVLTVLVLIYTVGAVWYVYAAVNGALNSLGGASSGDLDKALQQLQGM